MRANLQKAQRFFRPMSPEPVSDLPVDLDPEISFHNGGKFFSKKRNEFYLADPNVINSQQNSFFSHRLFEEKKNRYGLEIIQTIEKQVLLQTIDKSWREHLLKLEHLRSVIGFRGYAQRDPLNEYKSEAYELFEVLLQTINEDVTKFMAFFQLVDSSKIQNENSNAENAEFSYNKKNEYNEKNPQNTVTANWGKVGRNSPCPCGSGKKFKNCHGRN